MDDLTQALKVPPHSIDAEQSILGGLLLNNDAWDQVISIVVEDDFYRRDHRLIFRAIRELVEAGQPCDVVTLSERLESQKNIHEAGGLSYLGSLVNNTPSAANIRAYAEIVRERSVLRQLIRVGNEIADNAYHPDGRKSDEILESAEKTVFEIADKGAGVGNDFSGMTELLKKTVDRIDELYQKGGSFTGVPTGFNDFDKLTSGLQPADLVIVAGRPSMGKTTFAMNIAENAAIDAGIGVAVFSMEMPADSLTLRMLSSLGRINQTRVRSGQLDDDDWPRLTSAVSILSEAQIFIDDTPALSPTEMRSRLRRLKRKHNIGLIVVDYLQLMQIKGNTENRVNEISEISRGLKTLAKEMNVPVIALSQLNRGLEQRPNKRPVMSDLRECVAADTRVLLTNGQRVPIKELVGQTPELYATNEHGRLVIAKSDKVWCVGRKKLFKVYLASGRSIRATAEHRLMADLSWKKISRIHVGSRIALARKIPESEQMNEQIVKTDSITGLNCEDTLPVEILSHITQAISDNSYAVNKTAPLGETLFDTSLDLNSAPSRETVQAYATLLNDDYLIQQASNDLFWDTVVRIEEEQEEDVYDLSVPGYENWLADGIVSHNSGAIEQDADVIVFIYRDEVYNEDSADKGTAEVIIGKQRNGPLGTSRLTFLGKYTRFENHASIEYEEY